MYSNYEKFLLTRDLHAETSGHYLEKNFLSNKLKGVSKKKTCFKRTSNPNFADLLLTKKKHVLYKILVRFL